MSKRRSRVVRAINHFRSVEKAVRTTQFYDLEWCQGQVKAGIRLAKEIDKVLALYDEDFKEDIKESLKSVLDERGV